MQFSYLLTYLTLTLKLPTQSPTEDYKLQL